MMQDRARSRRTFLLPRFTQVIATWGPVNLMSCRLVGRGFTMTSERQHLIVLIWAVLVGLVVLGGLVCWRINARRELDRKSDLIIDTFGSRRALFHAAKSHRRAAAGRKTEGTALQIPPAGDANTTAWWGVIGIERERVESVPTFLPPG
jgi:hypothetical protein